MTQCNGLRLTTYTHKDSEKDAAEDKWAFCCSVADHIYRRRHLSRNENLSDVVPGYRPQDLKHPFLIDLRARTAEDQLFSWSVKQLKTTNSDSGKAVCAPNLTTYRNHLGKN
ncbi:hypothetical protein Y1Q_0013715 [Alligator mississippiensis]|uniref:Uncharacterized protein n=1 Tax=Alligator mississippiensis TaxID=8496 RepID=A0A151NVS4_ALLMI|nr:hypothetical protein Y1Q_0013715 [Alligator mississippiensis]